MKEDRCREELGECVVDILKFKHTTHCEAYEIVVFSKQKRDVR